MERFLHKNNVFCAIPKESDFIKRTWIQSMSIIALNNRQTTLILLDFQLNTITLPASAVSHNWSTHVHLTVSYYFLLYPIL